MSLCNHQCNKAPPPTPPAHVLLLTAAKPKSDAAKTAYKWTLNNPSLFVSVLLPHQSIQTASKALSNPLNVQHRHCTRTRTHTQHQYTLCLG